MIDDKIIEWLDAYRCGMMDDDELIDELSTLNRCYDVDLLVCENNTEVEYFIEKKRKVLGLITAIEERDGMIRILKEEK
jgi:hypothetical protein